MYDKHFYDLLDDMTSKMALEYAYEAGLAYVNAQIRVERWMFVRAFRRPGLRDCIDQGFASRLKLQARHATALAEMKCPRTALQGSRACKIPRDEPARL